MIDQIINGKAIAQDIIDSVRSRLNTHHRCDHRPPLLAVIVVGNNPASQVYVKKKREVCQDIGITSWKFTFDENATKYEILLTIDKLNEDPFVDGILVQMPLPNHLNPQEIIERIDPMKDVDGLHPYNIGRLATRNPIIHPCTPNGIMKMFGAIGVDPKHKEAVILGASNIVGRPMALELLLAGATVTICHRFTHDLRKYTQNAEIIVSAVGRQGILTPFMVEEGSIIFDVGIVRDPITGKITGDVGNFEGMLKKVSHITPVPGGVGPMTVAMLMFNIIHLYEMHLEKSVDLQGKVGRM